MKAGTRWIVFAVVILAVGLVFAVPYLKPPGKAPEKFAVTERPAERMKEALDSGRPVYLEFYSAQ